MGRDNSITLRALDEDKDILFFHKAHSDPASMQYYGMLAFESIEQSRGLMRNYIQSESDKQSFHRVICPNHTKEYMGEIGLFNINQTHHRANAYCILLPEHRKKGVSINASDLFYHEVFRDLDINRIQALVDSRNESAKKSLIGIGFVYEGRLSQYEFFNGEYIDIDVFALLKEHFFELYGK